MPKCTLCPRMLYKYDELIANEKSYHKGCFICGTCKATLKIDSFVEGASHVYCNIKCQEIGNAIGSTPVLVTTNEVLKTNLVQKPSSETVRPAPPQMMATSNRRIGGVAATLLKQHAGHTEDLTPTVAAAVAHASIASPPKPVISSVSVTSPPKPPVTSSASAPLKTAPPTPTPAKADYSSLKPTPAKFAVTSPKCACCGKSVYKAEEVSAMNQYWHKSCFKCGAKGTPGGCNKVLTLDSYKEHHAEPFCKNCFVKKNKEDTSSVLAKKSTTTATSSIEIATSADVTDLADINSSDKTATFSTPREAVSARETVSSDQAETVQPVTAANDVPVLEAEVEKLALNESTPSAEAAIGEEVKNPSASAAGEEVESELLIDENESVPVAESSAEITVAAASVDATASSEVEPTETASGEAQSNEDDDDIDVVEEVVESSLEHTTTAATAPAAVASAAETIESDTHVTTSPTESAEDVQLPHKEEEEKSNATSDKQEHNIISEKKLEPATETVFKPPVPQQKKVVEDDDDEDNEWDDDNP